MNTPTSLQDAQRIQQHADCLYTQSEVDQALDQMAAAITTCLLYTSPSPRDGLLSRMPSSA